jgi:SAM-dependent methyltransferase
MRCFYQESWQGIAFSSFTHVSFFHLAGAKFYATFYEELFRRYTSWQHLPAEWRKGKENSAAWLANFIEQHRRTHDMAPDEPIRLLSIGCGVGYMEKVLLEKVPAVEMHVNEVSTAGLRWLRALVPNDNIYIGVPPLCLPSDVRYDIIYIANVDYSVPTRELTRLLEELRAQLLPGGKIVCLSASLLQEDTWVGKAVNCFKIGLRCLLHYSGVRRQQFWGWRRTRQEYRDVFHHAGLVNVEDGYVDEGIADAGFETYFVYGEE